MVEVKRKTKSWVEKNIKYEYDHHKTEYDLLYSKISNHLIDNFYVAPFVNAVAYNSKDVVKKVLPEIVEKQNKDRLIPLNVLEPVLPGIYKQGDFLIFAHRYFRRDYSIINSLNIDFLRRFDQLGIEGQYEFIGLAIDWDLIGLAGTEKEYCERAYWYGPPFNFNVSQIPYAVTKYENVKYDEDIPGIKSTEFYWYEQDDERKFQCEEINLCPSESKGVKTYYCRYAHSIMKKKSDYLMHFDGAIRWYYDCEIIDREDKSINSVRKLNHHKKLWRIDGVISVSLWEELMADFYRGNELVIQYLNGEDEYSQFD